MDAISETKSFPMKGGDDESSYVKNSSLQVPKEVADINSSAWNKGRIHYTDAPNEVLQAYSAQYVMDMEVFLLARAHEVVCGGLMFLVIPGVIDGTNGSQTGGGFFHVLGFCLVEIAKMGMVDEAKVDSFNLPVYHTSPKEVNDLVEKNGYFNIERLEKMYSPARVISTYCSMCTPKDLSILSQPWQ
ncbi:probable S-adenosylmethionine-dependent methyltransferase At5g38100 isoform X2 [Papaver somniferum]|uniref:probable S-adenosylmethionine-dependent methyltransferase At5g38100 isoform X2 n=1 Tax=Papaver somniferum TaxID=3469 RepID=UPI000E702F76|nr:probable S-adenosylmethionine-dependent methyltransferase At5g38100 isoform X2 [Papaver somniferum]